MRLNKLILQSFVSFKDLTVIDFRQFGNKLLLLFGGSGVGKTTIFDGVSFALYGKGSGTDRATMNLESYHSDFAKEFNDANEICKREPLLVELEFEHNDKCYQVTRKLTWGAKGSNKDFTYTSELKAEGVLLAADEKRSVGGSYGGKKNDEVTNYLQELLGLNALQFSQVVILAQGEFEKFLKADAKEREEILTRLVDNTAYQDFQIRIHETKKLLNKELEELLKQIQLQLNMLKDCPSTTEQELQQYTELTDNLLQTLKDNLSFKIDQLSNLKEQLTALELQLTKANQAYALKQQENKDYRRLTEQLSEAQLQLSLLQQQASTLEQLQKDNLLLEKLLQLLPLEQGWQQAQNTLNQNTLLIQELQTGLSGLRSKQNTLEQLQEQYSRENSPKIQALTSQAINLEKILPFYAQRQEAQSQYSVLKEKLAKLAEEVTEDRRQLESTKQELDKLEQQLELLKEEGSAKVTLCTKEYEQLTEHWRALNNLKNNILQSSAAEQLHLRAQQKLEHCLQAEQAALDNYNLRMQELVQAQRQHSAGQLADYMRQELKLKGQVECPVCHVLHTSAAALELFHPLPEEEARNQALTLHSQAIAATMEAKEAAGKAQGSFEEKLEAIKAEQQRILPGAYSWQELSQLKPDHNPLMQALEATVADGKVKAQAKQTAERLAENKRQLEQQSQALKNNSSALEKQLEEELLQLTEQQKLLSSSQERVNNYNRLLQGYPLLESAAKTQLEQLQRSQKELQQQVEQAQQAYQQCLRELSKDQGKLTNAQATQTNLEAQAAKAQQALTAAIAANGFENISVYTAASTAFLEARGLTPTIAALQSLKQANQHKVELHQQNLRTWESKLRTLEEELTNKALTDLTPLEQQLEQLKQEKLQLGASCTGLETDLKVHQRVAKEVTRLFQQSSQKQKAFTIINGMDAKVNGRLTFNRFVLIDLFRTMLDRANERLVDLSSGQYELLPVLEGSDKKPTDGLEFTVHDCINQTNRLAGSNSGGEKFEISLSLALGLSDIIQSHGKKASRIDSLFIDEGFGTLGKEDLAKTTKLLLQLSGGTRQIGIISHNPVLEEAIKNQIIVSRDKHTRQGSKITIAKE